MGKNLHPVNILYYLCKTNQGKPTKPTAMKTYSVTYSGTSRFRNFESTVNANSEREAVENVYQEVMDSNYFPQEDGSIKDCDGYTVASATDNTIEYDGGYFSAEEVNNGLI